MRIQAIKDAAFEWFAATIIPQMSVPEQFLTAVKFRFALDAAERTVREQLDGTGLINGDEIDADRAWDDIERMVFFNRDTIPIKPGISEFLVKKQSFKEILDNAKRR